MKKFFKELTISAALVFALISIVSISYHLMKDVNGG